MREKSLFIKPHSYKPVAVDVTALQAPLLSDLSCLQWSHLVSAPVTQISYYYTRIGQLKSFLFHAAFTGNTM